MKRCINLDWMEVYCLEPETTPALDADYYHRIGWDVDPRPYGTRVFEQMFTLNDKFSLPFIEVRRRPYATMKDGSRGFLDPRACHLRLVNRVCYFDNAAQLLIDFMVQYGYEYQSISRVDLALDFEKFDSGDNPADFIYRYCRGIYSKINQADIAVHGSDTWEKRDWNSVSWGSKKSAISTKLYDKTMELENVKDKSYIRQAWALSGLVDDMMTLQKVGQLGKVYKPRIWRLEFSIQSDVKNWVVIEGNKGEKQQLRSIRNTPLLYTSRESMLQMFASLADHYFHFKYFQKGVRKDRCPDKNLFTWNKRTTFYSVEHVTSSRQPNALLMRLIHTLNNYRTTCFEENTNTAIDNLLKILNDKRLRSQLVEPFNTSELQLLQRLIGIRINERRKEPVKETYEEVKALLAIEKSIWGGR